MTELDFRRQLVGPNGLATMLGWLHAGFRPAMTKEGWRTPATGELGKGFPDLVLVHPSKGRLLFAELKSDTGSLSPAQVYVHSILKEAGYPVNVWRPRDLDAIAEVLR
jgi:hypothetical protein